MTNRYTTIKLGRHGEINVKELHEQTILTDEYFNRRVKQVDGRYTKEEATAYLLGKYMLYSVTKPDRDGNGGGKYIYVGWRELTPDEIKTGKQDGLYKSDI